MLYITDARHPYYELLYNYVVVLCSAERAQLSPEWGMIRATLDVIKNEADRDCWLDLLRDTNWSVRCDRVKNASVIVEL